MEPDYDIEHGFMQDDHYCVHGTYIGGWAGPDYLCGLCECGCFTLARFSMWDVAWMHNGKELGHTTTFYLRSAADEEVKRLRESGLGLDGKITERKVTGWIDEPFPDDEVLGTFTSRQQLREYEEAQG